MSATVALVPGVLALLPEYASLEDPVAELRTACLAVVGRLGPRVQVVASCDSGRRVGASLVAAVGANVCANGAIAPFERDGGAKDCANGAIAPVGQPTGVLVVGNGSAKRTERAPGHLDERAEEFDATLREALVTGDGDALRKIDTDLAAELWADVEAMSDLGRLLTPEHHAEVHYDAAPFGVQYWVAVWVPH